MSHRTRAAALILAFSTVAAGCGGSGGSGGTTQLSVWLMKDSAPDALIADVNHAFTAAHPGTRVKVQILDWTGRDVKWKTALAGDHPPDVMEMGNTDVLSYAASGALADLGHRKFDNRATWLTGLTEAGTYQGKLYGVPYYGGDRVVIYRKDLWQRAGLGAPPTTLADLQRDAATLRDADGRADFSGLYFPGRYQYAALSFVYDTGGRIATRSKDGHWHGQLSAPAAQQGLTNWANLLHAASRAPADKDETGIDDVLGQGHAAMIIAQGWQVKAIGTKYPQLNGQLDAFPMPGTAGPMPVFLGGSNLTTAAGGKHRDLAYAWISLMTGTKYETKLGQAGLLPNTTSLSSAVSGTTAVELTAATRSWFTPTSTHWSDVDNASVMQDMLQAIASGQKSVATATKDADTRIGQLLGTGA
jgi:N,N'-diacetylchitobiose transport system substrate-binding protein